MLFRSGRADISVVTRSYLRLYQSENPQQSARLLVSERVDQVYHHHALLRPQGPLDASQLASLLQDLQHSGRFGELVSRYHLRTAGEAVAEHADPMPR